MPQHSVLGDRVPVFVREGQWHQSGADYLPSLPPCDSLRKMLPPGNLFHERWSHICVAAMRYQLLHWRPPPCLPRYKAGAPIFNGLWC